MSNELVKTAPADRSSIKPFQFIPIHSRSRIGCRMMCPACCLLSASCVALVLLAYRFFIRLVHPLRSSVSLFAPSLVSRLFPLFACSFRLAYRRLVPSGMFVRLISSVCPARSRLACRLALLALPVSRVGGRDVPHLASISSCVSPAAPACLLTVLRSARPRVRFADALASSLRSTAIVPPLPRLAYSPSLLVSIIVEMSGNLVDEDILFFV